jgi:hypothetical protein
LIEREFHEEGAREELDKMLGIDRSKQGKDKGKKKYITGMGIGPP